MKPQPANNEHLRNDPRVVLTLDAGGTTFRFSATQGGRPIVHTEPVSTRGDDVAACLDSLVRGFEAIRSRCPVAPVAISFAFPGPADYPAGIIGDLPNLPAFRGGIPLGPILSDHFGLPVFINNDGDLFAFGEATAGFLPHVNAQLGAAGSHRRYRNLLGVTLGTGFGGGIVRRGELFAGDTCGAGEIWLLRNKLDPSVNAEDGACIRAIRRVYGQLAGVAVDAVPAPRTIAEIARGGHEGDRAAALEAYRRLGEVAGDAIAQALTIVDGLVVIGGGISRSGDLFMPALVAAMNDVFQKPAGPLRRIVQRAFNFEDAAGRAEFLRSNVRRLPVPGRDIGVPYDPMPRVAVGVSRLGTTEAIALGAYAFALGTLDQTGGAG